jgi:hypothetical protein
LESSLEDKSLFKDPTIKKMENSVDELTFGEDGQEREDCKQEYRKEDFFW